ncbi:MAG TPA: orotidine-5'-phosphate decarboxylase [Acidobacteriota bacterium]|nr:orotidine-5'-phosphate decarboxylase [Acidobacteriota bacterium]
MKNSEKVIVALDTDTASDAVRMAKQIAPVFPFFKIGSRLFTQAGPSLVRDVHEFGRVFLDLKFHDIPSVVAQAALNAAELGVSLLTLHTSGGSEMMKHTKQQLEHLRRRPAILGVTVLTSMSDLSEFGISRTIPEQVEFLASLAWKSGLDGIVCSPAELPLLRQKFPSPFLMVTPGIRSADDSKGDQKRVASPGAALDAGSDYLVIGRPIIAAADPVAAANRIAESL